MFTELHNKLVSRIHHEKTFLDNADVQIQILTGWFETPITFKDKIKKLIRQIKYKKKWQIRVIM